jgi:hypothetical protein
MTHFYLAIANNFVLPAKNDVYSVGIPLIDIQAPILCQIVHDDLLTSPIILFPEF